MIALQNMRFEGTKINVTTVTQKLRIPNGLTVAYHPEPQVGRNSAVHIKRPARRHGVLHAICAYDDILLEDRPMSAHFEWNLPDGRPPAGLVDRIEGVHHGS